MQRKSIISMIALALLVSLAVFPSEVNAQDTYTEGQYVSMLPEWNEIDAGRLVTLDDFDDYAEKHPEMTMMEIFHHFHRSWTPFGLIEHNMNINLDCSYIAQEDDFNPEHGIQYLWIPTLNRENIIVIIVGFNTTTYEKRAIWISLDPDWDYPDEPDEVPQNDFPRHICDCSIDDIPLKSDITTVEWAMMGSGLSGVILAVAITIYLHKSKKFEA